LHSILKHTKFNYLTPLDIAKNEQKPKGLQLQVHDTQDTVMIPAC